MGDRFFQPDLPAEVKKATEILRSFTTGIAASANPGVPVTIPRDVLESAQGIAVLTVVKAGFVISGRLGSGIVVARLPDGKWSAPCAIGTTGTGFGMQAGAEVSEVVLVLNTQAAVANFARTGQVQLGGSLSVVAGPLGRKAEASSFVQKSGLSQPVFAYSRTKGLFAGFSLEGAVILERSDANYEFYQNVYTPAQLLSGEMIPPEEELPEFYALLDHLCGGSASTVTPTENKYDPAVELAADDGKGATDGKTDHHLVEVHPEDY